MIEILQSFSTILLIMSITYGLNLNCLCQQTRARNLRNTSFECEVRRCGAAETILPSFFVLLFPLQPWGDQISYSKSEYKKSM